MENTHIPAANRKQILHKLSIAINKTRCEYNNHTIILGGDFNATPEVLETYIKNWPDRMEIWDNKGSKTTRQASNGKQIDHFLTWGLHQKGINLPTVLDHWDISDHYPLEWTIQDLVVRRSVTEMNAPQPADKASGRSRIVYDPEKKWR